MNNNNNTMDLYTDFIATTRYARWNKDLGRRETWPEIVDRYITYMRNKFSDHGWIDWERARNVILNKEAVPSMRLIALAGEAADQHNAGIFNCSYLPVKDTRAFGELLYLLACGSGVGFSVERKYVDQLPDLPDSIRRGDPKDAIVVEDTREGWGYAVIEVIDSLYNGIDPDVVYHNIREKGAPLKTFGGRASGPEPLMNAISGIKYTFHKASRQNGLRKLPPIMVHDMACMLAEAIIFGGVRRSAMISLSDLDDREMAAAKTGEWYLYAPYRQYANNSYVIDENNINDVEKFEREFDIMKGSGSGERGVFSRVAALRQVLSTGRRDPGHEFGTNPCSEIILRPFQQCNLSEIVVRPDDRPETMLDKVETATLFGVLQSTFTDFHPILRDEWRKNAEEERLLGVSLTGIYDNKFFSSLSKDLANGLGMMREFVVNKAAQFANRLGINQPTATTAIKPSGNVSQLVNSSSGIHPRYAQKYIRRVRLTPDDPVAKLMIDQNVPYKYTRDNRSVVFEFPIRAPENAITRRDINATEHLMAFMFYQDHWCEHKPSITIQVKDHEWDYIRKALFSNLHKVSGIALLPYDDTVYELAPYEEVSDEEFELYEKRFVGVNVDWTELKKYEEEDNTESSREFACTGSSCEIVGEQ